MIEIFVLSFILLPECIGKTTADVKINNFNLYKKIMPGDVLRVDAALKTFRRGLASGSVVGLVGEKRVCSCELLVCVPEIMNKFSPS